MVFRFEEHPPEMRPDYTFDFDFNNFTEADHAIWRTLYTRQREVLKGRVCDEYLIGLDTLGMGQEGIPHFGRVSDILRRTTGWELVTVGGLIPGEVFMEHLAQRRFPVTAWIRSPEQLDYLVEPDVFHDLFGHVPLLINPVFADYMQAFGQGGVKAHALGADDYLGKLYWFTVEFGLIRTEHGLRIYGSGIVSSKSESIYALESAVPHRLKFDVKRMMRTEYRFDDLQKTYFVIDSYEELFNATRPDFTPYYEELRTLPLIPANAVLEGDVQL